VAKPKAKSGSAWDQREDQCRKAVTRARKKLDEYAGEDAKERRALHKRLKRAQRKLSQCQAEAARRAKEGPKAAAADKAAAPAAEKAPAAAEQKAEETAAEEAPPAGEEPAKEEG
jgi:hypothetical protein